MVKNFKIEGILQEELEQKRKKQPEELIASILELIRVIISTLFWIWIAIGAWGFFH